METSFRGRFEIKFDTKGRVALPVSFRQALSKKTSQIVITNSLADGHKCLDGYTFSSWSKLEKKISKLSTFRKEVQAFQRFYISAGQVIEPDGQGRILIPQPLRQFAGFETEAVVVGMGEKFEIWNKVDWDRVHTHFESHFDNVMTMIADLDEDKK